jgi:hypothetical protein
MNPLPPISHHLFVAAIRDADVSPPKLPRTQTFIELPATTASAGDEFPVGEQPSPGASSRVLPARADVFDC